MNLQNPKTEVGGMITFHYFELIYKTMRRKYNSLIWLNLLLICGSRLRGAERHQHFERTNIDKSRVNIHLSGDSIEFVKVFNIEIYGY